MAQVRSGLLGLIGVLIAVSLVTFVLINLLPGDPAIAILGETATSDAIAALHAQLGLDLPIPLRYLRWLGNVLVGDFGRTFRSGDAVLPLILQRFPVTLEILVIAQAFALLLAVPAGVWTAYRARRTVDHVALGVSLGMLSTPSFLVGILLIYGFALHLGLFPATGFAPLGEIGRAHV